MAIDENRAELENGPKKMGFLKWAALIIAIPIVYYFLLAATVSIIGYNNDWPGEVTGGYFFVIFMNPFTLMAIISLVLIYKYLGPKWFALSLIIIPISQGSIGIILFS